MHKESSKITNFFGRRVGPVCAIVGEKHRKSANKFVLQKPILSKTLEGPRLADNVFTSSLSAIGKFRLRISGSNVVFFCDESNILLLLCRRKSGGGDATKPSHIARWRRYSNEKLLCTLSRFVHCTNLSVARVFLYSTCQKRKIPPPFQEFLRYIVRSKISDVEEG